MALGRSAAPAILGLFLALGLSAVFWLPMVTGAPIRARRPVVRWSLRFPRQLRLLLPALQPRRGDSASAKPGRTILSDSNWVRLPLILATVGVLLAWRPARRLRLEIACFVVGDVRLGIRDAADRRTSVGFARRRDRFWASPSFRGAGSASRRSVSASWPGWSCCPMHTGRHASGHRVAGRRGPGAAGQLSATCASRSPSLRRDPSAWPP